MHRYLNDSILRELAHSLGSSNILRWIEDKATELAAAHWSKTGGMSLSDSFLNSMDIREVKSSSLEGSAVLRVTPRG